MAAGGVAGRITRGVGSTDCKTGGVYSSVVSLSNMVHAPRGRPLSPMGPTDSGLHTANSSDIIRYLFDLCSSTHILTLLRFSIQEKLHSFLQSIDFATVPLFRLPKAVPGTVRDFSAFRITIIVVDL